MRDGGGAQPTILVIDDSPGQRALLARILTEAGLCDRVLQACDGIEGVRILLEEKPDLVLCDVEMPRLGGEKVLAIATAEPGQRAPFLMLTAVHEPARRTALLECGARDVISKAADASEIVARVALHLELARLQRELVERNQQLERLSNTDSLTKLRNRHFLDGALHLEWMRSQRLGTPFSVLMADLDHFKRINDQHGHASGDRVLVEVAHALQARIRQTDVIGRFGGEEFLVIIASQTEGAMKLAEHLRCDVEALRLATASGKTIAPTLSIGVASRSPSCPDAAAVVAAADAALYEAKGAGRNRVAADSRTPSRAASSVGTQRR